ncbi:nSTAND1 domain-containing NTPase, partial [Actinoplanes subglobosus]
MITGGAKPPVGEPYRRLDAFGEDDALWFYGRDDAVEQVLAAVRRPRPAVLLLGPSGSGKSSLVHAGVLPALRDGELPGSDQWIRMSVRPRQNLLAELDQAGLPTFGGSLPEAIDRLLADRSTECRLVLIIDQFEELLTPTVQPEAERVRLSALAQVSAVAGLARLVLILVMRDDFYPQLSAQVSQLRAGLVLIDLPAMLSKAQLDDIVRGPAKTAKLTWDAQLADRIVADVLADYNPRPPRTGTGTEPDTSLELDAGANGAGQVRQVPVTVLPLLELALYQVWTRRAGTRLTHDGYRNAGGIRGALSSWCSAVVDELPGDEKDCARQILTALVRPADPDRGVPAVRQQVPIHTLRQLITLSPTDPAGAVPVDRVLAMLTEQRIITTSTLHDTGTPDNRPENHRYQEKARVPVAELVHDALIRDWPDLQTWISADHRFQNWLRRTGERHRRWQQHPTGDDLLHGSDLAEGIDWATRRRLPDDFAVFLHASHDHQQARTRRTRRTNRVLAALLTIVVVAAASALWQWRTAVTAKNAAVTAQQIALSRQLAAQSAAVLPTNSAVADLLAVKAYRTSPTIEAVDSLHNAVAQPIVSTLAGYTEPVSAVAYSPDGTHLASTGNEETVRVWDLTTGTFRTLTGHTSGVSAVAYSPDGRQLATGSGDSTVLVWDLATGTSRTLTGDTDIMSALAGDTGITSAVAFSPDGRQLATANSGETVRVWDLAAGTSRSLTGHPGSVDAVAYSPDGRQLATASGDRTVRVWDLAAGTSRSLTGHPGSVYAMAYSPDGRLATAGDDGTVRVWDLAAGTSRILTGHTGPLYAVAFNPDGTHLATAGDDGTVRVWDLAAGTYRGLTGHNASVYAVAFSPDGTHLATASGDRTVRVWDLTSTASSTLTGHTSPVNAVAYSPDGTHLASTGNDKMVRVWDLTSRTSRTLTGHTKGVSAVAYSPDGTHVATASGDRTVRVWDLTTGASRTLTGHISGVNAVAYSPDGEQLAAANSDGTVGVWDLTTGASRSLTGHTRWVSAVAYSPDGTHVATASGDDTV